MSIRDVSGASVHAHQHGMARLGNIVAAHANVGSAALTIITLTLSNLQAKVLTNIPHVSGQGAHAHQHGMAELESTAVERASVANPALSLTTLYLCNLDSPMADHTRLDNIEPNVRIHSRHSLTV